MSITKNNPHRNSSAGLFFYFRNPLGQADIIGYHALPYRIPSTKKKRTPA
ncbi:hypothetical protein [Paenibacillus sp. JZ16]|nr:hypothetical protein [Paenibacillus sp. JZ16]